jgi:hypothetical protein
MCRGEVGEWSRGRKRGEDDNNDVWNNSIVRAAYSEV